MVDIENVLRCKDVIDENALYEYINLIEEYKDKIYDDTVYCENHHICPKSIFPEYRLSEWNIIRLPFDIHIETHRLLCLIYQTSEMKRAYSFITRYTVDDKIKHMTNGAFEGDNNPSKRPEVREKISNSKKGKKRPDMLNKKFFGADEVTYKNGIDKMKLKLSNTVIVRDSEGNRFRVSCDDQRYISGELIPFNLGVTRANSASKNPAVLESIMSSRTAKYEKISKYSYDEMVDYLYNAHINGKNIFKSGKFFSSNYVMLINKTTHNIENLHNSVVQRLSKAPD